MEQPISVFFEFVEFSVYGVKPSKFSRVFYPVVDNMLQFVQTNELLSPAMTNPASAGSRGVRILVRAQCNPNASSELLVATNPSALRCLEGSFLMEHTIPFPTPTGGEVDGFVYGLGLSFDGDGPEIAKDLKSLILRIVQRNISAVLDSDTATVHEDVQAPSQTDQRPSSDGCCTDTQTHRSSAAGVLQKSDGTSQ